MRKIIEPNKAEASVQRAVSNRRSSAVTELMGRVFRRRSTVIGAVLICLTIAAAIMVWGNRQQDASNINVLKENNTNIEESSFKSDNNINADSFENSYENKIEVMEQLPSPEALLQDRLPDSDVVVGQLGMYMFQMKTSDILYASDEIGESTVDGVQRMANVTIEADGTTKEYNTQPGTVQAMLDMAGISLGQYDEVSQKLTDQVKDGSTITVSRVSYVTDTVYKTVKAEKVTRGSFYRSKGSSSLVSEGKDGTIKETYRVKYKDGVKVGEELIDTTVVEKAVNEVYEIGLWEGNTSVFTNNKIIPSAAPKAGTYSKVITARSTAYTHTGNNTASGRYPKVGTVAVAKKFFKSGMLKKYTRLYIEGYGYAIVEDSGDSLMQNYDGYWIDVFMDKRSECTIWGMRENVKVYILN